MLITLKDVIAAKLGNIWVMADEVIEKVRKLVALAKCHVASNQVLVSHTQVKVIAEGVDVHQVPHLITLLSEEHGQLQQKGEHSLRQRRPQKDLQYVSC